MKREEEEAKKKPGEEAKNRHHITNDAPYKRAATTSLRKWFVYYVVGLRSQANRR